MNLQPYTNDLDVRPCQLGIIIMPCYNEESLIEKSISIVYSFIHSRSLNLHILIVDDGSSDNTASIVNHLILSHHNLYLLELDRNSGHQPALAAGIEFAIQNNYDFSITLDADLQDDLSIIPQMINESTSFHIVAAAHSIRSTDSLFKRTTASLFYKIANYLDVPVIPHHADYRLLSKRAAVSLLSLKQDRIFIRGAITKLGYNIKVLQYKRRKGLSESRPSSYSLPKMLKLAFDGILLNTVLPLRFISSLSLIVAFLSFIYLLYTILSSLYDSQTVRGWLSIVSLLLVSLSVFFIAIAVISEYLLRIYRLRNQTFHYQVKNNHGNQN